MNIFRTLREFFAVLFCSFICQVVSARRQRSDRPMSVKLPAGTTSLTISKIEVIPISALPKETTSELAEVIPISALPKETTSELAGLSSH